MIKVLMFGTEWCPHCIEAKPKFNELAKKHNKNITYEFIDCEKNPEIEANYQIKEYPTFIIIDEDTATGQVVDTVEEIRTVLKF